MEEAIRDFHKQFAWEPEVVSVNKLQHLKKFVVGGMGGSNLAGPLLAALRPMLDIVMHRDYGLPHLALAKERFWIASSYSGNTEETIDFAKRVFKKGYPVAAISTGGKLIEFAAARRLPHIVIPDTKIQPRSALGFAMVGLAAFLRDSTLLSELHTLASRLNPAALEKKGKALAAALRGKVPVVYSSTRNQPIAYNWKIKFNETGKIPAFCNVFPELNHNEMTGFDVILHTKELSQNMHFIFLTDSTDHPQIEKRMRVCAKLYEERGFPVTDVPLHGRTSLERMFSSLLIADWTALHLSRLYGTEAEKVPMVETFKRLIVVTSNKCLEHDKILGYH